MTRSRAVSGAALGWLLLVFGCGPQGDTGVTQVESAIVGGTTSTAYPEIGHVGSTCSGTLISQWWVLTAAHCVEWTTANPGSRTYTPGTNNGTGGSTSISADHIVNLGPPCTSGSCGGLFAPSAVTSPDGSGNNDIALLHLSAAPAVSRSLTTLGNLVESGVPPPAALLRAGSPVSTWGYANGPRQYKNWSFILPDSTGAIYHPVIMQPGDSGGPAIYSGGWIWGVNSTTPPTSPPAEIYGSIFYYYGQMCREMNNFPHRPCHVGGPLASLPSSCAPIATTSSGPWPHRHIASHLCEPNYMGQPAYAPQCCTTAWDANCVALAQQNMSAADWAACLAQRVKGDFDGDGRADYALRNTVTHGLHVKLSTGAPDITAFQAGADLPVMLDVNGDGRADNVFLETDNFTWFIKQVTAGGHYNVQFGAAGETPAIADFDGNGRDDFSLVESSTFIWHIHPDDPSLPALPTVQWGQSGDTPVPADYDGDGRDDVAVWRPNGNWYVIPSSTGVGQVWWNWGVSGDVAIPGDYDGDGKTDAAIFRPSDGTCWVAFSGGGWTWLYFGQSGAQFMPRDYDGDGKTDLAYYLPGSGTWHVLSSASGTEIVTTFGSSTETPF